MNEAEIRTLRWMSKIIREYEKIQMRWFGHFIKSGKSKLI